MGLNLDFSGIEIINDIKTNEELQIEKQKELQENRRKMLSMSQATEETYREKAVKQGLIPKVYKDARFDPLKIRANITAQLNKSGHVFSVDKKNFDNYASTCQGIINAIQSKELPLKSYIIGAPNGFGKTSFATDVIAASYINGWLTVPYISLTELAEIRLANERRLLAGMRIAEGKVAREAIEYKDGVYQSTYTFDFEEPEFMKKPIYIVGKYSWSEYINAEILVCYFTSIDCKELESQTLYTMLSIRAAKGLPTIVMISTSLEPYTNDSKLRTYIWNEIMSFDESDNCYDRVYHISCYKVYTKVINRLKAQS